MKITLFIYIAYIFLAGVLRIVFLLLFFADGIMWEISFGRWIMELDKNIEIAFATEDIAYQLAAVHIKSWQSAYKGIIPQDYLDSLSIEKKAKVYNFENDLNKSGCFFAAKLNDSVIGLMHLCNCRECDENAGEVSAIYILPEYCNMGYGSQLMKYATQFFKERKYSRIIVWVLAKNKNAINFYRKHGFEDNKIEKKLTIGKEMEVKRYSAYIE